MDEKVSGKGNAAGKQTAFGICPLYSKLVYFWVDDETDTVHVIAVIYEKRDQAEQLSKINIED